MNRSPDIARDVWRVLVTRDEAADGPLCRALESRGFDPVVCPVMRELPPEDPEPLERVAAGLDSYDWMICSSARAVRALFRHRAEHWPRGLRSAAVGAQTASALEAMGANPPPVVAAVAGAAPLWRHLEAMDAWPDRRVLVLTVADGRRELLDGLKAVGASVDEVVAYRMAPETLPTVAEKFERAHPDAAVFASPSAVEVLNAAVGSDALRGLRAVVAIGPTTGSALRGCGLEPLVPAQAGFDHAAAKLAEVRDSLIGVGD